MANEKKPRLFLKSDEITDGVWWHCGGPSVPSALQGLANHLKTFETYSDDSASLQNIADGIELDVREMTDAEVAALPDV